MLAVKIVEKKTIIARQIVEEDGWPADSPFAHLDPDMAQKVKKITQNNHINIPKLILTPIQGEAVISDFDLDSSLLSYHTNEHSILEEQLQHQLDQNLLNETVVGKRDSQTTKIHSIEMGSRAHQPSYYLILELQEYDFINYNSSQKSILLKFGRPSYRSLQEKGSRCRQSHVNYQN